MLFSQAWMICVTWAASYSLVSKIVFGILFAASGAIAESLLWPQDAKVTRRTARLIVGAVIGPIAVVGGMFLISLFYYAPSAMLQNVTSQAANAARTETEQNCQTRQAALSKQVSNLQAQVQADPYARKLIQAERERDAARNDAANANSFTDRIVKAADDLKDSEQAFEEAVNRLDEAWSNYIELTTGSVPLNPGVTENTAAAAHDQYAHRKSEAALAKAKVHDKAEALQVIELNR
jgi:seryl-tRNA synthetase